jgi:probable HAF family extracellular repeat protein
MRILPLAALGLFIGAMAAQAAPPRPAIRYAITDLGTVDGTGNSFPTAINNKGEVVGINEFDSQEYSHAFLYSGRQMRDIADGNLGFYPSEAFGINDLSEVVGYAFNEDIPSLQGFLYKEGQMLPLYQLGVAEATAINDFGQIAGYSSIDAPVTDYGGIVFGYMFGHVFFEATLGNPEPSAINNRGQVVGSGFLSKTGVATDAFAEHAFLYSDGRVQDLGALGTNPNSASYATGLNEHGQIVGYSEIVPNNGVEQSVYHAFLYSDGQMRDLGTLGGIDS